MYGLVHDAGGELEGCPQQLSEWMVVTLHDSKGLNAEVAARAMVERCWQPFGIPSVVTSDQGLQFAGAFWRTLCALLGVQSAFSQASSTSQRASRGGWQNFQNLVENDLRG